MSHEFAPAVVAFVTEHVRTLAELSCCPLRYRPDTAELRDRAEACAAAFRAAPVPLDRAQLLRWSCIGFSGLALNNLLVFVDFALMTGTDLSLLRAVAGVCAMLVLLHGLIWAAGR